MNISRKFNASANVSATAASRGTVQIAAESCIFLVLDIAALVGNVLVCLAWYRNPSLRTVTNIFILSLALTDLSMAVMVMPLTTASSIANKWIVGDYGYKMWGFGGYILAVTSLLTLMLLAINRYFRVVTPARYPNIYTKKRSKTMAVCAWIVTVVVGGVCYPLAVDRFRIYYVNPTKPFPVFPNRNLLIFFNVVRNVYIAVPSVVIAACYVKIYQTIHQHSTAAVPSTPGGHSAYGVEEAKITRLLTVVLVVFYICWLPIFLTTALETFKIIEESDFKYYNFYYVFPFFTSSVINPIIYATMSQQFRKEFLKILRGR